MKRFLNSVLCMCIAVFCTHAQKKNVTSVLEVMDITTGQRSVVKEFPFLIEAPNWTPDGNWLVYNSGGKLYKLSPESPGEPQLIHSDYATRCNNDHVISFCIGDENDLFSIRRDVGKPRITGLIECHLGLFGTIRFHAPDLHKPGTYGVEPDILSAR